VFIAAAPHGGGHELDYESEENAILAATGSRGIDLEVKESGNRDRLAE
jgi:hypothetical protein